MYIFEHTQTPLRWQRYRCSTLVPLNLAALIDEASCEVLQWPLRFCLIECIPLQPKMKIKNKNAGGCVAHVRCLRCRQIGFIIQNNGIYGCSFLVFSAYTFLITMSLESTSHQTPDLYCSEVTSEVIDLEDSDEALKLNYVLWGDSNSDESCLLSLLESENDQLQEQTKSPRQIPKTWLINAREEAINWILKVHTLLLKHCFTLQLVFLILMFVSICRCMLTTVLDLRQLIFL